MKKLLLLISSIYLILLFSTIYLTRKNQSNYFLNEAKSAWSDSNYIETFDFANRSIQFNNKQYLAYYYKILSGLIINAEANLIDDCKYLIQSDTTKSEYIFMLGQAYASVDSNMKAANYFIKAATQNFMADTSFLLAANAYLLNKDLTNSNEAIDSSIARNNLFLPAFIFKATNYLNNEELALAKKVLDDAPSTKENDLNFQMLNAKVNDSLKNYSQAIQSYLKIISLSQATDNLNLRLSNLFYATKQYKKSLEYLQKLSPEYLRDAKYYNLSGNSNAKIGKYNEAVTQYSEALKTDKNNKKTIYNRGLAALHAGKYQTALTDFKTLHAYEPKNIEYLQNIALVLSRMQKFEESIPYFEKALKINPNNGKLNFNFGISLAILNKHKEAIDAYSKSIELNARYAEAFLNRGISYLNLSDFKSGCSDLKESANLGLAKGKELHDFYCKAFK